MSRNIVIEKDLIFGETDREYLTSDVYRPSEGTDLPVILLIHGGAFQTGSKEMYTEWGPYLAKLGFVAIAVNYRISTPTYSIWPGVLDDILKAANWVVSQASKWKIDPQKFGVIGDSAGAHLASLFAFHSASFSSYKVRALVGVYGVYDLVKQESDRLSKMCEQMIGTIYNEDPDKYRDASPINYIDDMESSPTFDTDFLLLWGDTDNIAPPSQSRNFADKLKSKGMNVQTVEYPDQGHFWLNRIPGKKGGSLKDYPNVAAASEIKQFFKDTLKTNQEMGNFSPSQIKNLNEM